MRAFLLGLDGRDNFFDYLRLICKNEIQFGGAYWKCFVFMREIVHLLSKLGTAWV